MSVKTIFGWLLAGLSLLFFGASCDALFTGLFNGLKILFNTTALGIIVEFIAFNLTTLMATRYVSVVVWCGIAMLIVGKGLELLLGIRIYNKDVSEDIEVENDVNEGVEEIEYDNGYHVTKGTIKDGNTVRIRNIYTTRDGTIDPVRSYTKSSPIGTHTTRVKRKKISASLKKQKNRRR